MNTISPTLNSILATDPPDLLFHYTSPAGLIGIAESKRLWATNIRYLNDSKELDHAVDYSRNCLSNYSRREDFYSPEELELFKRMDQGIYAANRMVYVFSLTAERDLLSQWRAYSPPSGGYSIGFPFTKLKIMADKQEFYLTPCVYDHAQQYTIVSEIISHHLECFRSLKNEHLGGGIEAIYERVVKEFAQDVAKHGPVLKHRSFSEEREWRLVSSPLNIVHPKISYRAGRHSIVPYFEFDLVDAENSTLVDVGNVRSVDVGNVRSSLGVVVGPTADSGSAQLAVQSLLLKNFGMGCWHGSSEAPYRGW